jgi:hypothetical protein
VKSLYNIVICACVATLLSCNIDEEFEGGDGAESVFATNVFEYTPAPGQFINNQISSGFDGTETTARAACEYASKRLEKRQYVSLCGFGGYLVVGFGHKITNSGGGYDLAIAGNPFEGSSEPGVVWVMRDENENGEPDDVWYELIGSESGKSGTIHNYSVTYHKPSGAKQPICWEDSLGESGEIAHIAAHSHDSYYPAWIEAESYTLRGTRLAPRTHFNGSIWVQEGFAWGYVDNENDKDLWRGVGKFAGMDFNRFRLSDAVDADGEPANLEYIDFVKVQTALNSQSGGLGENSTEVFAICDYKAMISAL